MGKVNRPSHILNMFMSCRFGFDRLWLDSVEKLAKELVVPALASRFGGFQGLKLPRRVVF